MDHVDLFFALGNPQMVGLGRYNLQPEFTKNISHHPCMVYLPTFTFQLTIHVGKYTIYMDSYGYCCYIYISPEGRQDGS